MLSEGRLACINQVRSGVEVVKGLKQGQDIGARPWDPEKLRYRMSRRPGWFDLNSLDVGLFAVIEIVRAAVRCPLPGYELIERCDSLKVSSQLDCRIPAFQRLDISCPALGLFAQDNICPSNNHRAFPSQIPAMRVASQDLKIGVVETPRLQRWLPQETRKLQTD